jgi:hypothetical protein
MQSWQLCHCSYPERVGQAERDREQQQRSEGGEVLGKPGRKAH